MKVTSVEHLVGADAKAWATRQGSKDWKVVYLFEGKPSEKGKDGDSFVKAKQKAADVGEESLAAELGMALTQSEQLLCVICF